MVLRTILPLVFFISHCRLLSDKETQTSNMASSQFLLSSDSGLRDEISDPTLVDELLQKLVDNKLIKSMGAFKEGKGELSCHAKEEMYSCLLGHSISSQLKARTVERKLQLTSEIAYKLWKHLVKLRSEMAQQSQIIASVFCREYGEDIPPFREGQKICHIDFPHLPNERVVEGENAYQLAALLRGNIPFSQEKDQVMGMVLCEWQSSQLPSNCTATIPKSEKNAGSIFIHLDSAIVEICKEKTEEIYATLEPSLITQKHIKLPPEQILSVSCIVDSSQVEKNGKRIARCQLTLPTS